MVVDELDHGGDGAEVLDQGDVLAHPLLDLLIESDVGAPEAVDRLLGVADQEELAGHQLGIQPVSRKGQVGPGRQVESDLGLQGVGVLELVDEDPRPACLRPGPDAGVVAEHVAGPGQEVVEGGDTPLAALGRVFEDEVAKCLQESVEDLRAAAGEDHLGLLDALLDLGLQAVEAVPPPVGPAAPGGREHLQQLQRVERLALAVRLLQPLGGHEQLRHPLVHPVRGVEAVVQVARKAPDPGRELGRGGQGRQRCRGRPGGLRRQEVVVLVEGAGEALDPVRAEPEQERVLDRDAGQVAERGRLEPGPEALPELKVLRDLVEGVEVRRQPRLQRVGAQERSREGVDGVDRRLLEGGGGSRGLGRGGSLQALADAGAKLGGGRLGEGDGHQLGGRQAARGDQGDDPLDQGRGLPGPGPGFDEEGRLEVLAEAPADVGVNGKVHDHGTASRWWRSAPGSSFDWRGTISPRLFSVFSE